MKRSVDASTGNCDSPISARVPSTSPGARHLRSYCRGTSPRKADFDKVGGIGRLLTSFAPACEHTAKQRRHHSLEWRHHMHALRTSPSDRSMWRSVRAVSPTTSFELSPGSRLMRTRFRHSMHPLRGHRLATGRGDRPPTMSGRYARHDISGRIPVGIDRGRKGIDRLV